jgi:serine/threonine protein kinase
VCLEFCPYSDAAELFGRYDNQSKNAAPGANMTDYMLPEPVIWCAFEALIKAGLVMEHGSVGVGVQPPAEWDGAAVAHLDMKPNNVFIGEFPDQNVGGNWTMYPTFKVADFGHSCDDNRLPQAFVHYRGRGTESYQAPEQMDAHNYHGRRPIDPLDTKTNVWGVGITIMAMMNMWSEAGDKDFREAAQNENHPDLIPSFTADAGNTFSGELKNMVLSCLQFRHVNRPTFRALLHQLETHTGLGGPQMPDRAEGARFATQLNPAANATPLRHMLPNKYPLGWVVPAGEIAI